MDINCYFHLLCTSYFNWFYGKRLYNMGGVCYTHISEDIVIVFLFLIISHIKIFFSVPTLGMYRQIGGKS